MYKKIFENINEINNIYIICKKILQLILFTYIYIYNNNNNENNLYEQKSEKVLIYIYNYILHNIYVS